MSPTLIKLGFWIWLIIGLLPVLALIPGTFASIQLRHDLKRHPAFERYGTGDSNNLVFIHDTYIQLEIGGAKIDIYPRTWALWMLCASLSLLVISAIFLLHVPLR